MQVLGAPHRTPTLGILVQLRWENHWLEAPGRDWRPFTGVGLPGPAGFLLLDSAGQRGKRPCSGSRAQENRVLAWGRLVLSWVVVWGQRQGFL